MQCGAGEVSWPVQPDQLEELPVRVLFNKPSSQGAEPDAEAPPDPGPTCAGQLAPSPGGGNHLSSRPVQDPTAPHPPALSLGSRFLLTLQL